MSVSKFRNRLSVSGSLTIGGDVVLSRGAADRLDLASGDTLRVTSGTIDFNTDVQVVRTAADRLGLASGDELDLKANGNDLRLPGGTAAIATATFGTATGRIRIGTNGGTPVLGFELNGTTFFINRTGNL